MILAQISDPHVTVGTGDAGSAEALETAVAAVAGFDPRPDAVLLSGDVTEHGTPEEYERVAELLEPLPIPLHAIPGNHDDVDRLRAAVEAPGAPGEPTPVLRRPGLAAPRRLRHDGRRRGRRRARAGAARLARGGASEPP